MMRDIRTPLFENNRYVAGLLLLVCIPVISVAFSMSRDDKFDLSRREVLLRKLGDEVLLQSGDSTSRVLPVVQVSDDEYQVRFENELTFQPDSLVSTARRLLAGDPLTRDYIVNVLNCGTNSVAYGFAVSGNKKDDIIACKGREQPKACYVLNIKFKPAGTDTAGKGYLLGGLPFLAFVGFIFLRSVKPRRASPKSRSSRVFPLGRILFDAHERQLVINTETIELTDTEARLLLIFALSPNQTIARARLQKEIWEDQGVIVGRSLDMFISKLRKKLEPEPDIKIVVVRSKGYRLELSS